MEDNIKHIDTFLSLANSLRFKLWAVVGRDEAKISAQIRVQLEKKGSPIGPFDILIAGTALSNRATLVTHNVKEFGRIKNLSIEDWY